MLSFILLQACSGKDENIDEPLTASDYTKKEVFIEMRDGVKLFASIYTPKDTTKEYPVLLKRTPYSCRPYGEDTIPTQLMHNPDLVASGYIFMFEDTRGRWMSEGDFENVKPPYSLKDESKTDEITDSYDTYDWIVENMEHFNGNIGQYGNSYPGWTSMVGARANHPNLKAVVAMAPVSNFYFEDFNRYGLFAMNYIPILNAFGQDREGPTTEQWWDDKDDIFYEDDEKEIAVPYYEFFQNRLALTNFEDILGDNYFWKDIKNHALYDTFQMDRNWLNYYDKEITTQVMVVGGWNDEQNLYGILNSFKEMTKSNPNTQFVMGPWSHGHPKRRDSLYYLGDIFYGYNLAEEYQRNIEFTYFEHHLKGVGDAPDFKVKMFDTGKKEWVVYDEYPKNLEEMTMYLHVDETLTETQEHQEGFREYVSDPFSPVPYLESNEFARMAPKLYMTADQRFVAERSDVLTYTSQVLTDDITVQGEIKALIEFSTALEDADIYVKIIDVFPNDRDFEETDLEGVNMQNYQHLVRVGYIRGRYRDSFINPEPFKSNRKTTVEVPLLDVFHTFRKDHRIMIQIQSSMFPLFDVNPQQYISDIYKATKEDFSSSKHKVFNDSRIIFPIKK
jgi:putative CocE/NonD family hydrolase